MPDKLPLDPPNTTIDQAANGRWWVQCTLPHCNHYPIGLRTRDEARAVAAVHQMHHRRRGEHR